MHLLLVESGWVKREKKSYIDGTLANWSDMALTASMSSAMSPYITISA